MRLISPTETLLDNGEDLAISSYQELPQTFWDELNQKKEDFAINLDGYTLAADIPTHIVDRWIREGFDFYNAPINDILFKLRLEELDAFIVCKPTTFG